MNKYRPDNDHGTTAWYVVITAAGVFKPGISRNFDKRLAWYAADGHEVVFAREMHYFPSWSEAEAFEQARLAEFAELMPLVRGEEHFDLRACTDPVRLWEIVGQRTKPAAPCADELTPEAVLQAEPVDLRKMDFMFTDGRAADYLQGRSTPVDRSKATWVCVLDLIRFGATDAQILREIWYGPVGEHARMKGWQWLVCTVMAARRELDDERRLILAALRPTAPDPMSLIRKVETPAPDPRRERRRREREERQEAGVAALAAAYPALFGNETNHPASV